MREEMRRKEQEDMALVGVCMEKNTHRIPGAIAYFFFSSIFSPAESWGYDFSSVAIFSITNKEAMRRVATIKEKNDKLLISHKK
jgi:hypothetical protein